MLEHAYEQAIARARLTPVEQRFEWGWVASERRLGQPLWSIAFSAIEVLTGGELRRVKVCANPHGCGSQVKMRRQYAKLRSAI